MFNSRIGFVIHALNCKTISDDEMQYSCVVTNMLYRIYFHL